MIAAVDDSEILIGGQTHTILAAILVADAGKVEDALQGLKQEFGLSVRDEVRWNGMSLAERDREAISQELLVLPQQAATFVTTSEGTNRQPPQLADSFDKQTWPNPIGFNGFATEIALGRANKKIEVHDDRLEKAVSLNLLNYIDQTLSWTTWGEVPLPPDPQNPTFDGTWPFKRVGGFGLRLHSSVAPVLGDAIYSSRMVYMGCLH